MDTPARFYTCNDPSGNGQQFFHFLHASTALPIVSNSDSAPNDPVSPMTIDSLDLVDGVPHANKKNQVLVPVTTDVALSPDELADYFKQPVTDTPGHKWQTTVLSKDEILLLHYHRLFGHAGLRHIRKIIKGKLGSGLLEQLPAGKIHCPVCAISKSTRINSLASTNWEIERLDIMAVDLIGPFQVDSVDGGNM